MPAVDTGAMGGPLQAPVPATQLGRNAPMPDKTDPGQDPNSLNSGQKAIIKTIIGVGKSLGMGDQAIVTALAVANDESTFQNYASSNQPESMKYPHDAVGSDHQSVGVFQQQVGYGWGNFPEIMDVKHQAMAFFGASPKANAPGMLQQRGWQGMDPGALAQQIQQSGTPQAYYPLVNFARKALSEFGGSAPAVKLPVAPKAHGPFPSEDPGTAGMKAAATSAVKGQNQQQVNTAMITSRASQSKLNVGNPGAPPPPVAAPPPAPVMGRQIGTGTGAAKAV